ncbi:MAG: hydroxymethylbilane synthase [Chlamydiae bacterium]|nr:hydroxymethylbilane synthase [Chlamydiota bacterium]
MLLSGEILVAARSSSLSRVQVQEVLAELNAFHPNVYFTPHLVATKGDKDLLTSLRNMDKTNFFTLEIDLMLLEKKCRIAIHSAKDLPEPLAKGLKCIALTKGVDSSDVLVFRENEGLSTLQKNAKVATSSLRREEMIKELREDFLCVDIRGTIEERLKKLDRGEVDALVIAQAALIRLGLTFRNRITLPGPAALHQGQLAILCREEDEEMVELFSCIDVRNKEPILR